MKRLFTQRIWQSLLPIAALLSLGALCYLPFAHKFGFYNDDWYLLYGGLSQGVQKFIEIFSSDRPFRGYFSEVIFTLFGANAIYYNYVVFLLTLTRSLVFIQIIRRIWPDNRKAAYLAGILFFIFPGFLEQPNALDYFAHQTGFTLSIISIFLTVQSVYSRSNWQKIILGITGLILQVISLLLMEYYLGLEGLRWLLLIYCVHKLYGPQWRILANKVLSSGIYPIVGALSFLIWRFLIFNNVRYGTDAGRVLSEISSSPINKLSWVFIHQIQDFLNVTIFSWFVPAYSLMQQLRLKYQIEMIGIILAAGIISLAFMILTNDKDKTREAANSTKDMIWIGALGVIIASLPINLVDRNIIFDGFSRYALPGSISGVLLLVGLWQNNLSGRLRILLPTLLICLAAMTHYANGRLNYDRWETVRNFWWQVSWRVPNLPEGVSLLAYYPDQGIMEDYIVWGPANLIYFPRSASSKNTPLAISAATLEQSDLNLMRSDQITEKNVRGFIVQFDPSKTFILSMPDTGSCVHLLDAQFKGFSVSENPKILSLEENLKYVYEPQQSPSSIPPASIFGAEPSKTWCYYYEQAALARQSDDWETITRLGETAAVKDYRPIDRIEWLPFLEAYAYSGDFEKMDQLVAVLWEEPVLGSQVCKQISADPDHNKEQFPEAYQILLNKICHPFGQ